MREREKKEREREGFDELYQYKTALLGHYLF